MLTVCTDERSQEYWAPPQRSPELEGLILVPINGFLFRAWLGRVVPGPVHRTIFFPATENLVFSTQCWDDVLSKVFGELFTA